MSLRASLLTLLVGALSFPVLAIAVEESRWREANEHRPDQLNRDQDNAEPDQLGGARRNPDSPSRHPGTYWWLGVFGRYTENGLLIRDVRPNSPAWQIGLEAADILVCVNRYQIGYVDGQLFPLDRELQLEANRQGWVRLLVWDHRTQRLTHTHVRLRPISRSGRDSKDDAPYVGEILGSVTFKQSDVPAGIESYLRVTLFDGKVGELHSLAQLELPFNHDQGDDTVTMAFTLDEYVTEPAKGSYTLKAYLIGVNPDGNERKIMSSNSYRLKRAVTQKVPLRLKPLN